MNALPQILLLLGFQKHVSDWEVVEWRNAATGHVLNEYEIHHLNRLRTGAEVFQYLTQDTRRMARAELALEARKLLGL